MKVGDKGIDFAFAPDTYEGMVKKGARFFCRYSDGSGISSKVCKGGEIASAASFGADFFANYEHAETSPERGATYGKSEGTIDKDFWNSRGLAPGAGVIISWEPGNDTSKFNAVAGFIDAYRNAIGRPVGLYAGLPALKEMRRRGLVHFTWLPMSSLASNLNFGNIAQAEYAAKMEGVAKDNGINLCQNRYRWYNGSADENVYTTAVSTPFSHLQALGEDMDLTAQNLADIADRNWREPIPNTLVTPTGSTFTAQEWLLKAVSYAHNAQDNAVEAKAIATSTQALVQQIIGQQDPTTLAAALAPLVAAGLPPDQLVTQEMLDQSLRTVLGSVDNVPPTI